LPGFLCLTNPHAAQIERETPLPYRLDLADLLYVHLLDHLLEPNGLDLLNLLDNLPLNDHLLNDRLLHVVDGLNGLNGLNELHRLNHGLHVLDLLLHGHDGGNHVVSGPRGEGEESDGHEGEKELTHEKKLRRLDC
jgi:hypothetical protein